MLHSLRMIPVHLKEHYKKRQFLKYASCGRDLRVSSAAGCDSAERSSIRIGSNCDIGAHLSAKQGAQISIGDRTTIRSGLVGAAISITIGNDVIISNNVHIYDNNNHPTDPKRRLEMTQSGSFYGSLWAWDKSSMAPVVIEDNVWIGERSTILKGVTIGKGSVVGCDSVVTKNVPPFSVACGNPAKVVKSLNENQ